MLMFIKKIMYVGFCLLLIIFFSCRKIDISIDIQDGLETPLVQKFFNSYRTNDLTEKALVSFIKKKINREDVKKTILQIGYPRWDKTISVLNRKADKGNSDSSNTFFIHFSCTFFSCTFYSKLMFN